MLDLDLKSRLPIYEQLVNKLKELIIGGVLQPDEQLPTVRVLAAQLTINPNTIQKAYRELERQGYTYTLPGKGSFVYNIHRGRNAEKLGKLKQELIALVTTAIREGLTEDELRIILAEAKKLAEEGK